MAAQLSSRPKVTDFALQLYGVSAIRHRGSQNPTRQGEDDGLHRSINRDYNQEAQQSAGETFGNNEYQPNEISSPKPSSDPKHLTREIRNMVYMRQLS